MTITREQYFQAKPHTEEHEALFEDLNSRCESLVDEAVAAGKFERRTCPNTGSEISGSKGGSGDGGFRLPTATTGSQNSSHKEARAEDRYDPDGKLDSFLDEFEVGDGGNTKLEEYGLYREHPDSTPGWCHLTTRAPHSLKRTFHP